MSVVANMTDREFIAHFYESLKIADVEAVEACYADDVIFNLVGDTPVSGRWVGKDQCWGVVAMSVFAALKPETVHFSDQWRIVCASDGHVVAMMQGGATGLNGVDYDQTYCHIFKIENQKIIEFHEFFDTALAEAVLFDNPLSKPTGRGGEEFQIGS